MIAESMRVGVVGAGQRGAKLIQAFESLEGCMVATIWDSNLSHLMSVQEWFPHIPVATAFDDLLADEALEAIVVTAPVEQRHRLAHAALHSGKHVLVEAPVALKGQEASELATLAAAVGRRLGVGHTEIYCPEVAEVESMLTLGQLGEPCYAESARLEGRALGAGLNVIWELAVHDIAIALYLLKDVPVAVTAAGCRGRDSAKSVDAAVITVQYESGRFGHHHVSSLPGEQRRRFSIAGHDGSVVFDDALSKGKLRLFSSSADMNDTRDAAGVPSITFALEETGPPWLDSPSPLTRECTFFLESIRNGQEPPANGTLGRDVVTVLEAADLSIRRGSAPVSLSS